MSPRLHVFVLIDALGWSYLEGRDFLNDLLPYRQPLRTVLGYSSGAIPTILTGKPPAEHGHWNLFYYDPTHSPFRWLRRFGFLPNTVMESRVTRRLLTEVGRRLLGLGPLFDCAVSPRLLPFFNYTEKRNIYAPGGVTGAPTIFDELAAARVPHHVYSYHLFQDEEILQRARQDMAATGPGFYFLYLSEVDAFLHKHCQDAAAVDRRLARYADGLRRVFQQALECDAEASLHVFSDHGMTPVHRHHDLAGELRVLGLRTPEDFLAVYDSTMARFWFFSQNAREAITDQLRSSSCGRILQDAELEKMGILFPDRRHGELVFLLHPGWLLSTSGFNSGGWAPMGMHGYHPDDPYSDGVFLARHPPATPVRSLGDVHGCLRQALGA